jgi:protein-L-isoaspartate(D-aspartate) O-methyltransferase
MRSRRIVLIAVIGGTLACGRREPERAPAPPDAVARPDDPWARPRARMVDEQIAARGVEDARVLDAMRKVPRHELVPETVRDAAYEDHPVPIGYDQTISQPYIVAVMTEAARVEPGDRVLEVGTGSGYQAAVLAELGADVYSIEIVEPLAKRTAGDLERIGYGRIHLRTGDGYRGWPEAAPFDAVIVTAAPPEVPRPLIDQLAVGGRLVIPVGEDGAVQELRVITRTADGATTETLFEVRFVPMTGEAQGEAR